MIGVGIDVVDVERFAASLSRTPALADKLFTGAEVGLEAQSLAARFAAKEALAKALGAPGGMAWHDCEVRTTEAGQPYFHLTGTVADRLAEIGGSETLLSLSHDGGIATAIAVVQ